MSINKVILIGHVGKDPEVFQMQSGDKNAKFSLATSETYKNNQGEKVTNTEWHNIVCWKKLAEIVEQYVKKGMMVYVDGKIKTRSYDNKEGVKVYTTEIMADSVQMLGNKSDNHTSQNNTPAQSQPAQNAVPMTEDENDLPF